MTVHIRIEASGLAEKRIARIRKRAEKPHPALEKVGSYLRGTYRKQFATQGAYSGKSWQPLKPSYAVWKLKAGYKGKILVRSGDLRRSYLGSQESYMKIGPMSAEFGSDSRIAKFHQFGTKSRKTGKKILPARKVVVKTPRMVYDVSRIFERHLMGEGRADLTVSEP